MRDIERVAAGSVVLEGVSAGYGTGPDVLLDVSLTVPRSGLTRLSGPNGSGKSTAIELASGYLRPRRGTVTVAGVPAHLPGARARRRVCRAQIALHPSMTVMDHLALAAMSAGTPVRDLVGRAHEWGVTPWLDHRTSALSTGNARKAWVLFCTAGEFEVVLLDEPFDGLDATSRTVLARWMCNWASTRSVVLVAHGPVTGLPVARDVEIGTVGS